MNLKEQLEVAFREYQDKVTALVSNADAGKVFLEDGFFNAFWDPESYTTFRDRYSRNREAIKTLGAAVATELKCAIKGHETVGYKVFVESGSTTAGIGPAWMDRSSDEEKKKVIFSTNSLFFLMSLAKEGSQIGVIPGRFVPKYLAFLPFGERADDQKDENSYNELKYHLLENDQNYLAASHFGFLTGPFVGSRSNALFKDAMLNFCKRLTLVIPMGKILEGIDLGNSMQRALKTATGIEVCYPICGLGRLIREVKLNKLNGEDFLSLREVALEDLREPAYRQLTTRKLEPESDWIDFLKSRTEGKLSILVGIKEEESNRLNDLIGMANENLKIIFDLRDERPREYWVSEPDVLIDSPPQTALQHRVVRIVVKKSKIISPSHGGPNYENE